MTGKTTKFFFFIIKLFFNPIVRSTTGYRKTAGEMKLFKRTTRSNMCGISQYALAPVLR